jgi:hypothetical protein
MALIEGFEESEKPLLQTSGSSVIPGNARDAAWNKTSLQYIPRTSDFRFNDSMRI